jgi:hypothetical protein
MSKGVDVYKSTFISKNCARRAAAAAKEQKNNVEAVHLACANKTNIFRNGPHARYEVEFLDDTCVHPARSSSLGATHFINYFVQLSLPMSSQYALTVYRNKM